MLASCIKDCAVYEGSSGEHWGVVETVQGQVMCTCPSYRYSKHPWSCKHTERYKLEHPGPMKPRKCKRARRENR